MVRADILTEAIEAAVSRAIAGLESSKQKATSIEDVIKQTGIHSQVNGHYNVFQVKPVFNGPPPPYDVMDFKVSQPPISQRPTEEPEPTATSGRTANSSSSDALAPNVPPRAPTPPLSEIETPEQDGYGESDASDYESAYDHQPTDLHMSEWEAQQAFNTYLKPHQIGTGPGSSSSRAESSRSGFMNRKETLFLFFNCDRQHRALEGRLDTGADDNFISPRAAREVAHSYHKYRGEPIEVANGVIEMPEWLIFTYWSIKNDDNTFWHNSFIVFNHLPCDVIIGQETIKKNDILRASPKYRGCFLLRFTSSEGK
ncbi:uncharacterized protein LTHEOB_5523 [Lasiodiplodia theobromae]|uniref:uncharacterized protein n=1 Tax=Lasiodiplodia theobromae TaxID=45133 RepID=UPI0015C363E5|nr:uncharacterized protein LTHEOB_5523 [Lasiodiplodia theobromae]KAF4545112.1 hypothetical protein LTHEOB_5523 [Lasiodiplodia theobromae]